MGSVLDGSGWFAPLATDVCVVDIGSVRGIEGRQAVLLLVFIGLTFDGDAPTENRDTSKSLGLGKITLPSDAQARMEPKIRRVGDVLRQRRRQPGPGSRREVGFLLVAKPEQGSRQR